MSIDDLLEIIQRVKTDKKIKQEFVKRAKEDFLTRDENPTSHFCVYFAAFDSKNRQVFIGLHKKSGLWLFNGGHLDQGELPDDALQREINEEWGKDVVVIDETIAPALLTITEINNFPKQKCRRHYDFWYFIDVDKNLFNPNQILLEKEFFQTGWKDMGQAANLIKDSNTLLALKIIEKSFFS